MTTFDYLERVVVEGQLQVENIGDCFLQANNDIGEEYYLLIKTTLGWTEIMEYGPCIPDMIEMIQMNYSIKYTKFEYNQSRIEKVIDKFLNDPKKSITQAKEVYIDEIREFLFNPVDKVFPLKGGND